MGLKTDGHQEISGRGVSCAPDEGHNPTPPKEPAINVPELNVDIMVSYLSGGGAGNADVKLRSVVQPKYVRFDNYDDFSFANGPVKEGIERYSGSRYNGDEEGVEAKKPKVLSQRGHSRSVRSTED